MGYRTMLAILVNAIVLSMCFCPARPLESGAHSLPDGGDTVEIVIDAPPAGSSDVLIVNSSRRSLRIRIRGAGTILVTPDGPGSAGAEAFLVDCHPRLAGSRAVSVALAGQEVAPGASTAYR